MTPDRVRKVRALLDSPNAGERAAAQAALDRMPQPDKGTPEYFAALREWHNRVAFCQGRLGELDRAEDITLVRKLARYGGNPWDNRYAGDLVRIHDRLKGTGDGYG